MTVGVEARGYSFEDCEIESVRYAEVIGRYYRPGILSSIDNIF